MHGALGLIILLLVGLATLWACVVLMTVRLLTHPPRRTYASAVARGKAGDPGELATPRAFSTWTLKSGGGEFPIWDVEGLAKSDAGAPIVVLVHGWGDSKLGTLSRLPALDDAARIVALDLPGHGESSRRPRFTLGVGEVDVLIDLLDELRRQETRPIVLFGWSLGAGLSLAAAARSPERVHAVIAESPYRQPWTPARNVLTLYGLPHRLTLMPALWIIGLGNGIGVRWRGFDRAEHAVRLRASSPSCKVLIVHGELDDICPPADGRKIAEMAHGSYVGVAGKGHNDVWSGEGTPTDPVATLVRAIRLNVVESGHATRLPTG